MERPNFLHIWSDIGQKGSWSVFVQNIGHILVIAELVSFWSFFFGIRGKSVLTNKLANFFNAVLVRHSQATLCQNTCQPQGFVGVSLHLQHFTLSCLWLRCVHVLAHSSCSCSCGA